MSTRNFSDLLQTLVSDMRTKLDPVFPKSFGKDRYSLGYLPWTGRAVGVYPATPQGYVLEESENGATAWIAVDIDCGNITLAATIPYLDALRSFIRQNYSDITMRKAFVDEGIGPKNNQALVSALLEVSLDNPTDRDGLQPSAARKFI